MKESQFKTLQGWFESINQRLNTTNQRLNTIEQTMATKDDIDKLHGLIHQVHRRIDRHLSEDDSDKRLFRLALERLDDRVSAIESRPTS